MTEALTVPTIFGGKQIRIIERNGETWMPCKDLGLALGLNRTTLYRHIQRNRDFFGDSAIPGDILSHDEGDYWVNEIGLYSLLSRVSTGKIHPEAKASITRFRQDIPELLRMYRKKEIVPAKSESRELDEVVSDDLREAAQIAELTGTDPKLMQAAALRRHNNGMYDAFAEVLERQALSVRHGEPGRYNPSGLVELCGDPHLTADRLNKWLENYREDGEWKPFQYREGRFWRLTRRGMEHGREYQYNLGNGHSEPRISWRASVLYACGLKRDIAPDQIALPARVGR